MSRVHSQFTEKICSGKQEKVGVVEENYMSNVGKY